jgi:leader peptidase (prepilin peptidase)/N-methyltransferase
MAPEAAPVEVDESPRFGRPWAAEAMGKSVPLWGLAAALGLLWTVAIPTFMTGHHDRGVFVTVTLMMVAAVLPLIAIVDQRVRLIPNRILFPLELATVLPLAASVVTGEMSAKDVAIGAATGLAIGAYAFTIWFIAPRSFGYGDVKLTTFLAFILGTQSVWMAIVGLFLLPPLIAIGPALIEAMKKKSMTERTPFGPFIIAAAAVSMFVPLGTPPWVA